MDVKAMAKSKRSHSQHHANNSYPKPTAKSAAANSQGNSKHPSGKLVVDRPSQSRRPRGSELPSNSDRYLEEDDLGTTDGDSLRHTTDVVKPKSKGADYRYLISEARSQSHSTDCMDVYSSLDDEMSQGFGDMLSVRGEYILSWTAADYFIVEDKARMSSEVSFLSLNLNTLNEQLAKVDLSQRLFIEPDMLPPELRSQKCELKGDEKDQSQNPVESKVSKTDPAKPEDEVVLKEVAITSYEVGDNEGHAEEGCLSALEIKRKVKDNVLPESNMRPSGFESSQAEAELDMLLGSLGGTDVPLSSLTADQKSRTVSGLDDALVEPLSSNSGIIKSAYSQEDAIDNLLSSTSNMTKTAPSLDDGIDDLLDMDTTSYIQDYSRKFGNAGTPENSALSSKAKVSDDFDSWLETLG